MEKKPGVLFLSTGNSTRSQMAEGFLRELAEDRFNVSSAGIEPSGLDPLAREVMAEAGIDISKQHSKNVAESLKEHFAYVITVCDFAKERSPIFPFTPHLLHWDLVDPSKVETSREERKQIFRGVRDQIKTKVQQFMKDTMREPEKQMSAAAGR